MAGIFPPADKGGRPPGGNICNGYSPTHKVVGEGPLYIAADCTTVLTDCNFNSIVSEILAAIDQVDGGIPYNANRVDNLAQALNAAFTTSRQLIAGKVNRAGDTMEGNLQLARDPEGPLDAASKRYVDNQDNALDTSLRALIGTTGDALTTTFNTALGQLDARKINRAGDIMQGRLLLSDVTPESPMEVVSKAYVDNAVAMGGGGGPGGGEIPEAPTDGRTYGRGLLGWHAVTQEAPEDDHVYGRINGAWLRLMDDGEY